MLPYPLLDSTVPPEFHANLKNIGIIDILQEQEAEPEFD